MAGPLRIVRHLPTVKASVQGKVFASVEGPEPPEPPGDALKGHLDRLVRMIPSEVVSLYIAGAAVIGDKDQRSLVIWSVVSMIALFCVRVPATMDKEHGKGPQWGAVLLSALAFVIWLYTIGGPFKALPAPYYDPKWGALAVFAWSFFVPHFYRGD